jgi:hypothetical protein
LHQQKQHASKAKATSPAYQQPRLDATELCEIVSENRTTRMLRGRVLAPCLIFLWASLFSAGPHGVSAASKLYTSRVAGQLMGPWADVPITDPGMRPALVSAASSTCGGVWGASLEVLDSPVPRTVPCEWTSGTSGKAVLRWTGFCFYVMRPALPTRQTSGMLEVD